MTTAPAILPMPDFLIPMSEAADRFVEEFECVEYASAEALAKALLAFRRHRAEVASL